MTGPEICQAYFSVIVDKFVVDIETDMNYTLNMMNELDQLKEDICMESFGRSRNLALAAGQCVKCGTYDLNFRDEPSQREYKRTVWCQSCQDDFFGVEED